jgi:hypothetical protein
VKHRHVAPARRRWANQTVTREVDRHRARSMWGVLCAVLLGTTPFAVYLFEGNECLKLSQQSSELRMERERLAEHERRLRMQLATLSSLERIERWALEQDGLLQPAVDRTIVVAEGP